MMRTRWASSGAAVGGDDEEPGSASFGGTVHLGGDGPCGWVQSSCRFGEVARFRWREGNARAPRPLERTFSSERLWGGHDLVGLGCLSRIDMARRAVVSFPPH